MFFYLSKIFWAVASPLNFIWILCLFSLIYALIKRQKINKASLIAIYSFLILGFFPVGPNIIVLLERQYERPAVMPDKADGIIVLGGGFNAERGHITGMMTANSGINRAIDFVDLAMKYPKAKLVYSGGSGTIFHQDKGETAIAEKFLKLTAIDKGRVIYEHKSRNSFENVKNSKKLVKPSRDEQWIVVTSMFHMPRVMGVFKAQEWDVLPYPSSPLTVGEYRILPHGLEVEHNFMLLTKGVKELIGGVIYYFSGKSAFILPFSPLKSLES